MYKIKLICLFCLTSIYSFGQIAVQAPDVTDAANSNVFLDASTTFSIYGGAVNNVGKGMIVPGVDLVNFEFILSTPGPEVDGITFPTFFDGMIVYNTATGTTLTTGNRSSTATAVTPGFYYYSNLLGNDNYNNVSGDAQVATALGRWLPLGGESTGIKSKTVEVIVPANPTTATLDLGTAVIAADEVDTFLGAKIYDNSGNLVMTADSAYNKTTNLLTTGNGIMYQVLAAGTYQVVVDYK